MWSLLGSVVQNNVTKNGGFGSAVLVLVATESVARHIYLINTHTPLWVISESGTGFGFIDLGEEIRNNSTTAC